MSSKTYDTLKFIALAVTPLITFLCSVVNIWGIPYGQQITATLAALDTLVGAIVVIAKSMYDKKVKNGSGVYGDGDGTSEGIGEDDE